MGDQYNFFNPFMSARIIVGKSGNSYPFWTRGANGETFDIKNAGGSNLKSLACLIEIIVEMDLGYIPKIKAILNPPYEDAIRLLDSELVEFGENRLQVQFGYANTGDKAAILSPVFEGLLQRPEVSFGSDIHITLNAQGVGGNIAAAKQSSGISYKGTRREAIKEIAKRCEWDVDFAAADKDAAVKKSMDQKIDEAQGWRTDLLMLQMMTDRAGCVMKVIRNSDTGNAKVELIPRNTFYAKETPDHILSLYGMEGGQLGGTVYPLLAAATQQGAIWMPGISDMLMQEVDEKTKLVAKGTFGTKDDKEGQSSTGAAGVKGTSKNFPDADPNKPQGYNRLPGDPANKKSAEILQSAFSQFKASGMGIPLDVETLGIPTLEPGMVVQVRGLGQRLDRPRYAVHKVVHSIGTSGFKTNAHLIANTSEYLKQTLAVKSQGAGNTNQAETDGDKVQADPDTSGGSKG